MVMIFVRKRNAVMSGLTQSLLKLRCQFDAWLTSIDLVAIKEWKQNLTFRSLKAVEGNGAAEKIKEEVLKEKNACLSNSKISC